MRKLLIFFSAVALFALSCGRIEGDKSEHVYIISTNDIHATIDALPHLATIIKEYETRGEVLLVDSGDRVTGNAYVDDAREPGVPLVKIMNELGYDVATLGNHEFDKGSERLDAMLAAAEYQVVCANVEALNGAIDPLEYTIVTLGGVDIGFVGVVDTDGGGRPLGGKSSYVNYTFTSDVDTAYEAYGKVAAKCDFVVLLSHMGRWGDERLVERGASYDWIAGGHSHDLLSADRESVHMSQNNKNLRYVTVADIEVRDGEIVGVAYEQLKTSEFAPDEAMVARVEELKASDPELNTVEGVATEYASKEGVANFTIAALASYPYADGFVPEVTFYHYGGVRLDEFSQGNIKRADILNNDPFVSTIYVGSLTPEQMRDFILTKYNNGTAEAPDKESHYPYFRSDVPYTIVLEDSTEAEPDAVDVVFDLEPREYRVAMCNYIADNYIDSVIVARQFVKTDITVREAMLRYIRSFEGRGYKPDNECRQREVKSDKGE